MREANRIYNTDAEYGLVCEVHSKVEADKVAVALITNGGDFRVRYLGVNVWLFLFETDARAAVEKALRK